MIIRKLRLIYCINGIRKGWSKKKGQVQVNYEEKNWNKIPKITYIYIFVIQSSIFNWLIKEYINILSDLHIQGYLLKQAQNENNNLNNFELKNSLIWVNN